ncbi:RNA-binding protein Pasilla isoform X3 [Cloeon dipterum]|uniref:RNA-binding protein Pasilla isoform X3 n=1 Tax=Cloeon dipterum TaxID=197152 RepID=UPI00322057D6
MIVLFSVTRCLTSQVSSLRLGTEGTFHFKVLVPSIAAGAIIGKGGETIAHLQKDAGARVKMSKANDFYPGTSERVCLISGSIDAIMAVLIFIMEKIKEKPDPNAKPAIDFDNKTAAEREKQVKILVPNSTAGMVIGKGGNFIKQIKEESGSYVQISQKAKDQSLQERCITVIGDIESNKVACSLILQKVVEDPQSGSCLNVSYADVTGPVANFNPTGSPYANVATSGQPTMHNSATFSSTCSLNSAITSVNAMSGIVSHTGSNPLNGGPSLNLSLNLNAPAAASNPSLTAQLLEHIKVTLRTSGYSDQATMEITSAMSTLATYGILGMGLGLAGPSGLAAAAPQATAFLPPGVTPMEAAPSQQANGVGNNGVFGPIGTIGAGLGKMSPTQQRADNFGQLAAAAAAAEGQTFDPFRHQPSPTSMGSPINATLSLNNNSFGLGTQQAINAMCKSPTPGELKDMKKVDLEVGENIVGAILGPGGRSLVEIQHLSGANIQISKKGTFAPGTRNRIVSISGIPNAIATAQYLIEQRINEEETKRARNNVLGVLQ